MAPLFALPNIEATEGNVNPVNEPLVLSDTQGDRRDEHQFINPVEVSAANEVVNTRSDYILGKLRRRKKPIGGTTRRPVAELNDIIMCYPEKARNLRRWYKSQQSEP